MTFAKRHEAAVVLAAAVAVCSLSGCLPLQYPRAGEPVSVRPGEALVVGRIRLFAAGSRSEFLPFSRNPLNLVSRPHPLVSLELRRKEAARGVFSYKAYPAVVVEDDGSFYWILRNGEYSLLGNPRFLGSPDFDPRETETLARFTVPEHGKTAYVGTLVVSLFEGLFDVVNRGGRGETDYEIDSLRIVDERDEALSKLQKRFPSVPGPVTTELMSVE